MMAFGFKSVLFLLNRTRQKVQLIQIFNSQLILVFDKRDINSITIMRIVSLLSFLGRETCKIFVHRIKNHWLCCKLLFVKETILGWHDESWLNILISRDFI